MAGGSVAHPQLAALVHAPDVHRRLVVGGHYDGVGIATGHITYPHPYCIAIVVVAVVAVVFGDGDGAAHCHEGGNLLTGAPPRP